MTKHRCPECGHRFETVDRLHHHQQAAALARAAQQTPAERTKIARKAARAMHRIRKKRAAAMTKLADSLNPAATD